VEVAADNEGKNILGQTGMITTPASSLSEPEIHSMIAQRLKAKMSRNFDRADNIQRDLIDSGVFVHDGMK
jgi:cysteinyl-tRNA synthetase